MHTPLINILELNVMSSNNLTSMFKFLHYVSAKMSGTKTSLYTHLLDWILLGDY